MPYMRTERRQKKAYARQYNPAERRGLPSASPSPSEQRKEEWHRDIHNAIGSRANDTSNAVTTFERPIFGIVLLKDAIIHGEAYQCEQIGK